MDIHLTAKSMDVEFFIQKFLLRIEIIIFYNICLMLLKVSCKLENNNLSGSFYFED